MMRFRILSIVISLALAATVSNGLCLLCGDDGVDGLKRPSFKVDQWGMTCSEVSIKMAFQYGQETDECIIAKEDYHEMCCGEEEPEQIKQRTNAPQYTGESKATFGVLLVKL
jgi:hypothetical protein